MSTILSRIAKAAVPTVVIAVGLAGMLPSVASAATIDGTLTLTNPSTNAVLSGTLPGGTVFNLTVPNLAACTKDTFNNGYHEYTYMVQPTGSFSSVNAYLASLGSAMFSGGSPSTGFGFFTTTPSYIGPLATAPTTGQISNLPLNSTSFAPAFGSGGSSLVPLTGAGGVIPSGNSATWQTGVACADPSGLVVDNWNVPITFTTDPSNPNDPAGFTITLPSGTGNVPETPLAVGLPLGGAAVLAAGFFVIRRRQSRPAVNSAA